MGASSQGPGAVCRNAVLRVDEACRAVVTVGTVTEGAGADPCIVRVDGKDVACLGSVVLDEAVGEHRIGVALRGSGKGAGALLCSATLRVEDRTPPRVHSVRPARETCLWPAGRDVLDLRLGEDLAFTVEDACGPAPSVAWSDCLAHDEEGETVDGCRRLSPARVRLAAPPGSGRRAFHLELEATDASGNTATGAFELVVRRPPEDGCLVACLPDPDCFCPAFYEPVVCNQGTFANRCRAACACATGCRPAPPEARP